MGSCAPSILRAVRTNVARFTPERVGSTVCERSREMYFARSASRGHEIRSASMHSRAKSRSSPAPIQGSARP